MRILILNYEFPPVGGGGGRVSAELAYEFAKAGHEVQVLTSACDTLPRYEQKDGYEIFRLPVWRHARDHCSIPEMIAYMGLSLLPTLRHVYQQKPDIVHAHFGIPTGPLALATRLLLGQPYVLTIHAGDVPGFMPDEVGLQHKLTTPLSKLIWKQAERVVAVSEGIRRMAKKITPNLPIDVIHNGVRRTQNMGARKQPTTPLKFIFAGRVANQKGVIYLVHALAGLPRDNTWQLTLIGDGPRRTEIEAAIQSYHLGEQIKLVGWLDHTEVVRLYQEHDVFVLPSVTEGMPMVLLEAMSYSMPAIATDVSGSQDLIVPGQTGWLVPPQDATALKQAIEDCLNTSPEHLVEMGNAARQRVLEYFTWDTLSNQYLSLFEEVVKGR